MNAGYASEGTASDNDSDGASNDGYASGGTPTDVNYVVHQGPLGWQATDVLLDGTISQVAVQRSDFTAQLNQGGAPALIAGLKKKVATLSGS